MTFRCPKPRDQCCQPLYLISKDTSASLTLIYCLRYKATQSSSRLGRSSLMNPIYFYQYPRASSLTSPQRQPALRDACPACPYGTTSTYQISRLLVFSLPFQRSLLFPLTPLLLPALWSPLNPPYIRFHPRFRFPVRIYLPSTGCVSCNIPWSSRLVQCSVPGLGGGSDIDCTVIRGITRG